MLYCSVTVRPHNMLNVRHMIDGFQKKNLQKTLIGFM